MADVDPSKALAAPVAGDVEAGLHRGSLHRKTMQLTGAKPALSPGGAISVNERLLLDSRSPFGGIERRRMSLRESPAGSGQKPTMGELGGCVGDAKSDATAWKSTV